MLYVKQTTEEEKELDVKAQFGLGNCFDMTVTICQVQVKQLNCCIPFSLLGS